MFLQLGEKGQAIELLSEYGRYFWMNFDRYRVRLSAIHSWVDLVHNA
jgi:hypothetical protein